MGLVRPAKPTVRNSLLRSIACGIILFGGAIPARGARASASGDTGRLHWKPVAEAQLKLDDKPPLTWNVYQPDKKDKKEKKKDSKLILVLLGRRYLLLDIKAKLVFQVSPSDLQAQGTDFESDDLAQAARLVPSADWSERDVGPAELIRLTLKDYGRVLDVQLPHPPDMRAFY